MGMVDYECEPTFLYGLGLVFKVIDYVFYCGYFLVHIDSPIGTNVMCEGILYHFEDVGIKKGGHIEVKLLGCPP